MFRSFLQTCTMLNYGKSLGIGNIMQKICLGNNQCGGNNFFKRKMHFFKLIDFFLHFKKNVF